MLTPLVALAAARTLGPPGRPGPFRAAWSTGLLLAVTAAFVPLAWVSALVLAAVGMATVYRDRGSVLRMLAALSVAPVVLMPWTGQVIRDPVLLVTEAGTPGPGLSDSALAPWAVLLQHPGGPGAAPVLLGIGVVLAGWGALLRSDLRLPVLAGWAVAGVALVLGVIVSRLPVTGPTLETPVAGWPGYPTALSAAVARCPPELRAEGRPRKGEAALVLRDEAEMGIDVLVLGSRGYGPVLRTMLGSVAAELMRSAPCPVLVYPRGTDSDEGRRS